MHYRHLLTLAIGLTLIAPAVAAPARKPNVLVILSDDVGWGEYGFQGGGIKPGSATRTTTSRGSRGCP